MEKKVIRAALLGFGTVGTGVYKVLEKQKEEMTANGTVSFFSKECIQRERADGGRFRSLYFRAEDF